MMKSKELKTKTSHAHSLILSLASAPQHSPSHHSCTSSCSQHHCVAHALCLKGRDAHHMAEKGEHAKVAMLLKIVGSKMPAGEY